MTDFNEQVIKATIAQIGPQGIPGQAATISVGSVTTGAAGTDASVTNSGTATNAVLDFVIPRGNQGLQGEQGQQGVQGIQGATGNGISSIEKLSSAGLVDTYRINFTNNTYFDFTVTNGSYISSIDKTSTSGLVDTYTITLTNGNTQTFTVTNGAQGDKGETGEVGNGILNILKMSTAGLVDNYRINFTNGTFFDYTITNAKSITGISKIGTSGLIDTYEITFNDNTSFSFPVTNGNGVAGVTLLSWVGLDKTYRMSFTNGTHFDFVVSNGAAGQVEWGGVAGVLSNQHDLQDALDDKANMSQTHALKGYEDAGEALTDAEGLADVKSYAHSTFGLSKFTVVGSPIITDDGVMTMASTSVESQYIDSPNMTITNTDNFKFTCSFVCPDLTGITSYNALYQLGSRDEGIQCLFYPASSNAFLMYRIDGSDVFAFNKSGIYSAGDTFTIITERNGSAVNTTLVNKTTNTKYTHTLDLATKTISVPNKSLRIVNTAMQKTYNLKDISVSINGIPVFSGNQTGIDTIKPDNYTVVGTPTITDDGVANGFGNTSYITYTPYNYTNSFELDFAVTPNGNGKVDGILGSFESSTYRGIKLDNNSLDNKTFRLWLSSDGENYDICNAKSGIAANFTINVLNYFRLTWNGATYKLQHSLDNVTWNDVITQDSTAKINTSYSWIIGGTSKSDKLYGYTINGLIDLNAFKIYVDGDLVYQPCLKIPYTESKTGSKIVDSYYRARIADMYEQYGYAPYYTLSDTNFTLPQGELYGLIGQRTLRDSYRNGITYWELYSDRTLEIGGTCTSGVEYNLPKEFVDTNYVLTIPYSAKTTSTFTPSASGDFIAKGIGTL